MDDARNPPPDEGDAPASASPRTFKESRTVAIEILTAPKRQSGPTAISAASGARSLEAVPPPANSAAGNTRNEGSPLEHRGFGPTFCFPNVGETLFGFRLLKELGRGAFARVYLARQGDLADPGSRPQSLSAIHGTEPQTLAQLQHTHIVPIYSAHEDLHSGIRAVCMPYFGGTILSAILEGLWSRRQPPLQGAEFVNALEEAQGPLPAAFQTRSVASSAHIGGPEELAKSSLTTEALDGLRKGSYVRSAVWIAAKLAEGLQHAHSRGVLHRDIKPSNILIGADGQPLLLDFNVSVERDESASTETMPAGTISYMSPEHLRAILERRADVAHRLVDHRSDIYALGLVLFEMLAGRKPFETSEEGPDLTVHIRGHETGTHTVHPVASEPGSGCPLELWRALSARLRLASCGLPRSVTSRPRTWPKTCGNFLADRPLKHAPELRPRRTNSRSGRGATRD